MFRRTVRLFVRAFSPWLPWLLPATVAAYDLATPVYRVETALYLLPCALAVTVTTTTLTERRAERRVPRQLAEMSTQLARIAEQAPVAEAARVTWLAAAAAFGADVDVDHLPRAVGGDPDGLEETTVPIPRRPQLIRPINGRRRRA